MAVKSRPELSGMLNGSSAQKSKVYKRSDSNPAILIAHPLTDDEENPVEMSQFLDSLLDEVVADPSKLIPFTEERLAASKALIAGVVIEE